MAGHKSKKPKLFLIEEIVEEVSSVDESDGSGKDLVGADQFLCLLEGIGKPEISLHAITGFVGPRMMRIKGKIGRQWVVILIDTRSTHNFVDQALLKGPN